MLKLKPSCYKFIFKFTNSLIRLCRVLAWPIVVLTVMCLFHPELNILISHLDGLNIHGASLHFATENILKSGKYNVDEVINRQLQEKNVFKNNISLLDAEKQCRSLLAKDSEEQTRLSMDDDIQCQRFLELTHNLTLLKNPDKDPEFGNYLLRLEALKGKKFNTKILWIDDNQENDVTEQELFAKFGIAITPVENTNEAILQLKKNSDYALIISDFKRLGDTKDGFGLLKELHQNNLRTKVIYYAAATTGNYKMQDISLGALNGTPNPFELFNIVINELEYQEKHGLLKQTFCEH